MLSWKLRTLKRLDGLIGPLLCRCLGPGAKMSQAAQKRKKKGQDVPPVPAGSLGTILVIRPGGLGDAALTLPMIASLRGYYHGAVIDVLAERRNAEVYRLHPGVRAVYCYDSRPIAVLNRLRKMRYDAIIDTEQFHHLSLLAARLLNRGIFADSIPCPDIGFIPTLRTTRKTCTRFCPSIVLPRH